MCDVLKKTSHLQSFMNSASIYRLALISRVSLAVNTATVLKQIGKMRFIFSRL
jgi:hypothetical protein